MLGVVHLVIPITLGHEFLPHHQGGQEGIQTVAETSRAARGSELCTSRVTSDRYWDLLGLIFLTCPSGMTLSALPMELPMYKMTASWLS